MFDFKLFFNKVWKLIKPVVMMVIELITSEVFEMIVDVVRVMAATDLSSSDKRKEALITIKDNLKQDGIEMSSSILNLLLELAVQKMKQAG